MQLLHFRTAQARWTPTNWERFLKRAHEEAQLDQIRELAKTATESELREIVDGLLKRIALAEWQARVNGETIRSMQAASLRAPEVIDRG